MGVTTKIIDDITYELSNGAATVVRQKGLSKRKIIIPSFVKHMLKKYPVTRIVDNAFLNSKITSIEIEAEVTEICDETFYGCHELKRVKLPNSVKRIGDNAFHDCYSLADIELPEGLTSIGGYAFYNCQNLYDINIPRSVTVIGANAFTETKALAYHDYVYYAGKWAVYFYGRHQHSYDSSHIKLRSDTVGIACGTFSEFPSGRFERDYNRLDSVEIPNGVKYIGACAFSDCVNLTSISIPESVKTIGQGAFRGCVKLGYVKLPIKITEIEKETFKNCSELGSIIIPSGATSIGDSAFMDCTSLSTVAIPAGVSHMGECVFSGCSSLTINCEAEDMPSGWNEDWNNSARPVKWGCNGSGAFDKVNK